MTAVILSKWWTLSVFALAAYSAYADTHWALRVVQIACVAGCAYADGRTDELLARKRWRQP